MHMQGEDRYVRVTQGLQCDHCHGGSRRAATSIATNLLTLYATTGGPSLGVAFLSLQAPIVFYNKAPTIVYNKPYRL